MLSNTLGKKCKCIFIKCFPLATRKQNEVKEHKNKSNKLFFLRERKIKMYFDTALNSVQDACPWDIRFTQVICSVESICGCLHIYAYMRIHRKISKRFLKF